MRFSKQMLKILLVLRKHPEGLTEEKIIARGERLDKTENVQLRAFKSRYKKSIEKLVSRGLIIRKKKKFKLTGEGIDRAQEAYSEIKEYFKEYQHLI